MESNEVNGNENSKQAKNLKLNYYALYLAIFMNKSVTKSCIDMGITSEYKKMNTKNMKGPGKIVWPDVVYEDIIRKKETGIKWKDIAEGLDVSDKTLFQKVKRYMGENWENRGWK